MRKIYWWCTLPETQNESYIDYFVRTLQTEGKNYAFKYDGITYGYYCFNNKMVVYDKQFRILYIKDEIWKQGGGDFLNYAFTDLDKLSDIEEIDRESYCKIK